MTGCWHTAHAFTRLCTLHCSNSNTYASVLCRLNAVELLGIVPGAWNRDTSAENNEKPQLKPVLDLISDELLSLSEHGILVHNSLTGGDICVRAHPVTVGSDYRGLESFTNMTLAPTAQHACLRCWLPGSLGNQKRLYGRTLSFLPKDHALREVLAKLNRQEERPTQGNRRTSPLLREADPTVEAPEPRTQAELAAMLTVLLRCDRSSSHAPRADV